MFALKTIFLERRMMDTMVPKGYTAYFVSVYGMRVFHMVDAEKAHESTIFVIHSRFTVWIDGRAKVRM